MKLNLQSLANRGKKEDISLIINERVPDFLEGPCEVLVNYEVKAQPRYYLIHLKTSATLRGICQRCSESFTIPYQHEDELCVCLNEEDSSDLLDKYECVMATNGCVDLLDIITDELYLHAPQHHASIEACNQDVIDLLLK
jgi:uncharacterized metal-binding protein YceD (DUF177 family)